MGVSQNTEHTDRRTRARALRKHKARSTGPQRTAGAPATTSDRASGYITPAPRPPASASTQTRRQSLPCPNIPELRRFTFNLARVLSCLVLLGMFLVSSVRHKDLQEVDRSVI